MLSIAALLIVVTCVVALLSGRLSPLITFVTFPIIIALCAGFSLPEIQIFFIKGLHKVTPIAVMFIFAILYFALMQAQGLFDPLIHFMIRKTQGHLIALAMGTVLVASLAHLDGSGASTFLITIPALLPIYRTLHMSPYLLLLLVSSSASVMNMLPWGGPLGRAAAVIESDPVELWHALMPIQGFALLLLLALAYVLGKREQRRIAIQREYDQSMISDEEDPLDSIMQTTINTSRNETLSNKTLSNKTQPSIQLFPESSLSKVEFPIPRLSWHWWMNLSLTLGMITLLLSGVLSSALVFMLALAVALMLNYPEVKAQQAFMQKHAWSALHMAMIILAAGLFLGILKESKMLHALAQDLIQLLPDIIVPYLHMIIGIFGVPFELLLNTDAYYFALLPIVEQAVNPHGVSSESVVYAMVIGNIIGTFISPFSPALWLALGLANLDMGTHIRYAFIWVWGFSLVLMGLAWTWGLV